MRKSAIRARRAVQDDHLPAYGMDEQTHAQFSTQEHFPLQAMLLFLPYWSFGALVR